MDAETIKRFQVSIKMATFLSNQLDPREEVTRSNAGDGVHLFERGRHALEHLQRVDAEDPCAVDFLEKFRFTYVAIPAMLFRGMSLLVKKTVYFV
jgi:hypothetical protein